MQADPIIIPLPAARRLLLSGLSLLRDRSGPADASSVLADIERLGFVQVDSINIVERAHHHIVWARRRAYRPGTLDELQRSGQVFEHWTHDASIIPSSLFPHWRCRFERVNWNAWIQGRLGKNGPAVLEAVLDRVRREGPLLARDFEHDGVKGGPWWDWKPAKAALECWWRRGELAIARREGFQKVYDLTERVLPSVHPLPPPARDEHVDWACRSALERLGVATPREIAQFWNAVRPADAAAWCKAGAQRAELIPARLQGDARTAARLCYAWADWKARAEPHIEADAGLRVLSPFDPLVRDRARLKRLFGFDYRFEAYVPEGKRQHGYFVLPILETSASGCRLVGRLDPKHDRDKGVLQIRSVRWEPTIKPTAARIAALHRGLAEYSAFLGADRVTMPRRSSR